MAHRTAPSVWFADPQAVESEADAAVLDGWDRLRHRAAMSSSAPRFGQKETAGSKPKGGNGTRMPPSAGTVGYVLPTSQRRETLGSRNVVSCDVCPPGWVFVRPERL
jgi:hypothetical protein